MMNQLVKWTRCLTFAGMACLAGSTAIAAEGGVTSKTAAPEAGILFHAYHGYEDNTEPIASPSVTGVLLWVYWSQIEKEEGVFDWSVIDNRIRPWAGAGKHVALRILWSASGTWGNPLNKRTTPEWVWDKGAVMAYSTPTDTQVPLQWDPIYTKYAQLFQQAMAKKYDGDPNILFVDVTPGGETNPCRGNLLRGDPSFREIFMKTPASDGRAYSDELWFETVKAYVDFSAETFHKTPLLVTLNNGSLEGPARFTDIGNYCVAKGFYVGQNGLNGNSYREDSSRGRDFLDWGKKTKLFFEMVAATSSPGTGTLMEVMQAAERIHCSWLAVSGPDVLKGLPGNANYDPEYEKALEYGASILGSGK